MGWLLEGTFFSFLFLQHSFPGLFDNIDGFGSPMFPNGVFCNWLIKCVDLLI